MSFYQFSRHKGTLGTGRYPLMTDTIKNLNRVYFDVLLLPQPDVAVLNNCDRLNYSVYMYSFFLIDAALNRSLVFPTAEFIRDIE